MRQDTVEYEPESIPIYVAEFSTSRGSKGERAFSNAGYARQWLLDQIERDYELDEWTIDIEAGTWSIQESDCRATVRKMAFHNPRQLQRRHPTVFD